MWEICGFFFSFFVWFCWLFGWFICFFLGEEFLEFICVCELLLWVCEVVGSYRGEGRRVFMDFHFFLLGVNLGFLGTLCAWKRTGGVCGGRTTFLFLFLFSASERERDRGVCFGAEEREKSAEKWLGQFVIIHEIQMK